MHACDMCAFVRVCVCVHVGVSKCISVYECLCVCVCVYLHVPMYACCVCLGVYLCVCEHVRRYAYAHHTSRRRAMRAADVMSQRAKRGNPPPCKVSISYKRRTRFTPPQQERGSHRLRLFWLGCVLFRNHQRVVGTRARSRT